MTTRQRQKTATGTPLGYLLGIGHGDIFEFAIKALAERRPRVAY